MKIDQAGHDKFVCAINHDCLSIIFVEERIRRPVSNPEDFVVPNLHESRVVECVSLVKRQNSRILNDNPSHTCIRYHCPSSSMNQIQKCRFGMNYCSKVGVNAFLVLRPLCYSSLHYLVRRSIFSPASFKACIDL
jgi:hypothetical protein